MSSYHHAEHEGVLITEAMARAAEEAGLSPAVVHDLLIAWGRHHEQALAEQRSAIRAAKVPESCGAFGDHDPHEWGGGAYCTGNGPLFRKPDPEMLDPYDHEFPDGSPRLCDTRITTGLMHHPQAYCVRANGHGMYDFRWKHPKRWDHYGHSFYEEDRGQ